LRFRFVSRLPFEASFQWCSSFKQVRHASQTPFWVGNHL
jgi:hypothetical protein